MKRKVILIFIIIFIIFSVFLFIKIHEKSFASDKLEVVKKTADINDTSLNNNLEIDENNPEAELSDVNDDSNIDSIKSSKTSNISEDDIILNISGSACFSEEVWKSDVRNNISDCIIIGKVASIDGATNYNDKVNEYTLIKTLGQIEVLKVIKGDITEKKIPFIRLGGIINFKEYEKGLVDSQKAKMNSMIKNLTEEEKENKYVSQKFGKDIDIEEGVIYLMYLTYSDDYDRYSISFF
ncbi:MAG: hypothetical protein HFJ45_05185 [Clostridia bacterium]|nr:hypothetical protein [Clostridia bacterium]